MNNYTMLSKVVLQKRRKDKEDITEKQKLWEFITTMSALQEMLKEFFKLKLIHTKKQHENI